MPHTITPKQCARARSLLKWNIYDIVSKSNLSPMRIERFERATIRLTRPENDELFKLFTKHDIVFTSDFEVVMKENAPEEERVDVNLNERDAVEVLEEIEAAKRGREKKEAQKEEEDKDKAWIHTPEYNGPDRRNAANKRYYTGPDRRQD